MVPGDDCLLLFTTVIVFALVIARRTGLSDVATLPPGAFQRYGVTLRPLQVDDLEMVRAWRNDPSIASMMVDQSYITSEQQAAWFTRIRSSPRHFIFVAHFRDEAIGVASLTLSAEHMGEAEPALYIAHERYRHNLVPFCVVFALLDFAFEQLALTRLNARVFAHNVAARRFNASCGYQPSSPEGDGLNSYQLVPADYYAARTKISRFIRY